MRLPNPYTFLTDSRWKVLEPELLRLTEANRARAEADGRTFVPLPKRWVIERSFSWLTWCRKLTASYDRRTQVVEAWVLLGSLRYTLSKM